MQLTVLTPFPFLAHPPPLGPHIPLGQARWSPLGADGTYLRAHFSERYVDKDEASTFPSNGTYPKAHSVQRYVDKLEIKRKLKKFMKLNES